MKMMLLKSIMITAVGLFGLVSCGKSNAEASKDESKIFSIVTAAVTTDSSSKDNFYIGTVEAELTVPVSFSGLGTVQNVFVNEGQFVSKGQTLATLESSTSKNSLDMAIATQKQAQDAFDRLQKVYKEGNLPEIKFVEIETKLQQANSSVQISKKMYSDCILKSPVSAMVGVKAIETGSSANPLSSAFTLYKIDNVFIKVSVPENEISKIKKGQVASINVTALNKQFTGKVEEIGVVANTISHTYDVKIRIKNSNNELKPGMLCNANLSSNHVESCISIPNDAVISEAGKQYVYLLNSDKKSVKKTEITTGNYNGNNITVRSGLNLSDVIVVSGQYKLSDNAEVKVTN